MGIAISPKLRLSPRVVQHVAKDAKPFSLLLLASKQQHLCSSHLNNAWVAGSVKSSYKITVPLNNCSSSTHIYVTALLRNRLFFFLSKKNRLEQNNFRNRLSLCQVKAIIFVCISAIWAFG